MFSSVFVLPAADKGATSQHVLWDVAFFESRDTPSFRDTEEKVFRLSVSSSDSHVVSQPKNEAVFSKLFSPYRYRQNVPYFVQKLHRASRGEKQLVKIFAGHRHVKCQRRVRNRCQVSRTSYIAGFENGTLKTEHVYSLLSKKILLLVKKKCVFISQRLVIFYLISMRIRPTHSVLVPKPKHVDFHRAVQNISPDAVEKKNESGHRGMFCLKFQFWVKC